MKKRGFYFSNEAWYYNQSKPSDRYTAEIMFGVFSYRDDGEEDGCVAEMAMRWYDLQPYLGKPHVPKLEVFEDAWLEFSKMGDLIQRLAFVDSKSIQPKEFIQMLLSLGFEDRTKRENPYKQQEEEDTKKRKEILDAMPEEHKRILGLK